MNIIKVVTKYRGGIVFFFFLEINTHIVQCKEKIRLKFHLVVIIIGVFILMIGLAIR